ncbi:hypothetical protein SAMN02927924_01461 [Sphingobium faniae]|nr:hypothetical protein SAMN02927924_01461 [Sphingobium faniae]
MPGWLACNFRTALWPEPAANPPTAKPTSSIHNTAMCLLDDMIEDGGMQRPVKDASRFMRLRPQDSGPASFKTGQSNPQLLAGAQFRKALETKARGRQIGDPAGEPVFPRTANPDADGHGLPVGSALFPIRPGLPFGIDGPMSCHSRFFMRLHPNQPVNRRRRSDIRHEKGPPKRPFEGGNFCFPTCEKGILFLSLHVGQIRNCHIVRCRRSPAS